jgi:hypothetical protein
MCNNEQRNETMKQMSTGFGLAVLGACVLGAAFIASPRFGQQAFAQVTGDRHIVSASVNTVAQNTQYGHVGAQYAYRIWSDNSIEVKYLGCQYMSVPTGESNYYLPTSGNFRDWRTVDNGLTTFVPADVDASGTVDPADLGGVLIEMGNTQEGNPPPPIDCTINAPR